jgi:hypothetical protein
MNYISKKIVLPVWNKEPPPFEIWLPFSQTLPSQFFKVVLIYSAFETIISTNPHTRHIELPEHNLVILSIKYIMAPILSIRNTER